MSSGGDERFYVRSAGRITGPFALSRLLELKRLGRLPSFCELSRDRMKWEPAGAVMGGEPVPDKGPGPGPGPGPGGGPGPAPPAAEQWYYTDRAGNQIGPVARAQVAAVVADDQTMVWKEGMPEWKPHATVFAADGQASVGSRPDEYRLAEVGALLMMIAGWLWTAALAALTVNYVIGGARGKLLAAGLFLPGILGLAHLLMTGCGMAFLLTAPGRNGVRASLITAMSFAVVHLFLLVFIASDISSESADADLFNRGVAGQAWRPVVSGLPFSMEMAAAMVNSKFYNVLGLLLILLGLVEGGRVVSALFAARGLATQARHAAGRTMSLSTIITLGAVLFAVNLAVLSAFQHVMTMRAPETADPAKAVDDAVKYAIRVFTWVMVAVHLSVTTVAVLYGLSMTFAYTGFKRANRAGWL